MRNLANSCPQKKLKSLKIKERNQKLLKKMNRKFNKEMKVK